MAKVYSKTMARQVIYGALADMGTASHFMSMGNTELHDLPHVPEEFKQRMKDINAEIHELHKYLRTIREGI